MTPSALLFLPLLSLALLFLAREIRNRIRQQKHGTAQVPKEKATENAEPYQDIEPLNDFDWASTSPIRNAPLKPKYHLTMALETISISDLIAMDNTYVERMEIRRSVMEFNPEATLQCNPICEPAVLELYDWMINTYLPKRFPTIYSRTEKGLYNSAGNETIPSQPTSAMDALRTLGGHVDTDFLLLLPSSTAPDGSPIYHLEAFVTCFPSGFSTRKKLGLKLADIHIPVPGYKSKLEKSMDRFFARIEVGKVVKRSNWAITTDSRLFAEGGNHLYENGTTESDHDRGHVLEQEQVEVDLDDEKLQADIERQKAEVVIENCRLRSERQTLFRLPRTKALVFSFKTYQYLLSDVKKEGYGEELARAMEGLSEGNVPEMDFYKRGVVWREKVGEYLRS